MIAIFHIIKWIFVVYQIRKEMIKIDFIIMVQYR